MLPRWNIRILKEERADSDEKFANRRLDFDRKSIIYKSDCLASLRAWKIIGMPQDTSQCWFMLLGVTFSLHVWLKRKILLRQRSEGSFWLGNKDGDLRSHDWCWKLFSFHRWPKRKGVGPLLRPYPEPQSLCGNR